LLRAAREGHADRFDLINRCIGGEELPRQIIEPDVAPCRRERLLLGRSHLFLLKIRLAKRITRARRLCPLSGR
jgi:hypothetical protein